MDDRDKTVDRASTFLVWMFVGCLAVLMVSGTWWLVTLIV